MKNIFFFLVVFVVSSFAYDYSMASSMEELPQKSGYWYNYKTPVRFFSQIGYMDFGMGLKVKMSPDNYFYMMQSLVVLHNWFDGVDYFRLPTEFCVGETNFHGVLGFVMNLTNDGYENDNDLDFVELAFGVKYDFNAHIGVSSRLYIPISRSYMFLLTDFVYAF